MYLLLDGDGTLWNPSWPQGPKFGETLSPVTIAKMVEVDRKSFHLPVRALDPRGECPFDGLARPPFYYAVEGSWHKEPAWSLWRAMSKKRTVRVLLREILEEIQKAGHTIDDEDWSELVDRVEQLRRES